jgi:hypothetical protein
MSKYRKKPVVIEAEVYRPGLEDGFYFQFGENPRTDSGTPYIETLEGKHFIKPFEKTSGFNRGMNRKSIDLLLNENILNPC